MDFKTLLRTVRELKRMDAQKAQVPSEEETATTTGQDCRTVDDRVIQAVMRQGRDGHPVADSQTEFAYSRGKRVV